MFNKIMLHKLYSSLDSALYDNVPKTSSEILFFKDQTLKELYFLQFFSKEILPDLAKLIVSLCEQIEQKL